MSGWWLMVVGLYAGGVVFAAGVLWADERRTGDWPVGWGDWLYWVGSWVLASVLWPLLGVLWGRSRPAPPAQPGGRR